MRMRGESVQKSCVSLEVESYPGAVAGYRAFRFADGELTAMTECGASRPSAVPDHTRPGLYYPAWSLGENEASCPKGDHPDGETPHADCSCGFWMHRTLEGLLEESVIYQCGDVPVVLALVAGWGRTVEHTHGMRVQHARPLAFIHLEGSPSKWAMNPIQRYVWGSDEEPTEFTVNFRVPEELAAPRISERSGHEGRITPEEAGGVILDYGLMELALSDRKAFVQAWRPAGVGSGEDEVIVCEVDSVPEGYDSTAMRLARSAAALETVAVPRHMRAEITSAVYVRVPRRMLGDDASPIREDLYLARDLARLAISTPASKSLIYTECGVLLAWSPPLKNIRNTLRLIELAISGEHLTPEDERTEREVAHIDRLFEMRREIVKQEARQQEREQAIRDAASSAFSALDNVINSWGELLPPPPPQRHSGHNSPAPTPNLASAPSPLKQMNTILAGMSARATPEQEPSCCLPGTHGLNAEGNALMCRRAFLVFCRVGRRMAGALVGAFGKLRPERLSGSRPSNSTPPWYAFHRRQR